MSDTIGDDGFDPFDDAHYSSVASFVALLRGLGYRVRHSKSGRVEIRVPADEHPLVGFRVAEHVWMAQEAGLFQSTISGAARVNTPLVVILE
jgi:hypothetical protein